MSNKYLYVIPLSLIEVILQLAFFWLAPDVACYWAVYAFGSVLTVVHIGVSFGVCSTYGTRKSAAIIVAGSICQIILLVTCCVLLASSASVRNAVFSLMISSMLYIVIVTLLILAIEDDEMLDTHTVSPFDDGAAPYYDELDNEEIYINKTQDSISTRNLDANTPLPRKSMNLNSTITPPPLPVRR